MPVFCHTILIMVCSGLSGYIEHAYKGILLAVWAKMLSDVLLSNVFQLVLICVCIEYTKGPNIIYEAEVLQVNTAFSVHNQYILLGNGVVANEISEPSVYISFFGWN